MRAFHDGNGDGVGDFRGLIEKLDYLQELGVTALWLTPLFEQVVAAEFQAQVTLVRAAKDEVRDPSPGALEALRSASAALTEVRSRSRD